MGCCFASNKIHHENENIPVKIEIVDNKKVEKQEFHWGYKDGIGPENWSKFYPNASCSHQSPIEIITYDADYSQVLEENNLIVNYPRDCFKTIQNNGHTFVVSGSNLGKLSGGPLKNATYSLLSFHMHWGDHDQEGGSEHILDGRAFSAEVIMINYLFKI